MTSSDIPQFPPELSEEIGNFYEFEIFVEDSNIRMWKNIIKNILPDNSNFREPIPCPGKGGVLAACENQDKNNNQLFIIYY